MMIKGSLLCIIPIVKRFRAIISKAEMPENQWFWGFLAGINFNPNNDTLGNQFPSKHVIWRKNGVDRCKIVVSRGGRARNPIKNQKNNLNCPSHFTPLPGWPCEADFYNFFRVVSHRRHNHLCEILSRLVKGLGDTATQNRGFPIDFDYRSYNSVTQRARPLHCDFLTLAQNTLSRCRIRSGHLR